MMPAAKHFDPVLGVDIHIIQPPGPVPPVPIPHPFVGFLIDPFDYVPIVGSTVSVNGVPRAQAGTSGKCVPPHIPIGGVFVKPPANECEMFMGSSTVCVDGDAFSYLALPALSCQCIGMPPIPRINPKKKSKVKSLVLPTSVVLPIPAGPPVLVGGAPTISLMALGMKVGMAALGRAFKKLRQLQKASRRMKAISDKIHKAANKLMDKLGIPPSLRNRVHRGVCSITGHPVDIATGKVFTDRVDFSLPGPIPFEFERIWYSTSSYRGPLGHGWHHTYDEKLYVEDEAIVYQTTDGRHVGLPHPAPGSEYFDRREKITVFREGPDYAIRDADDCVHRFAPVRGRPAGELPVTEVRDSIGNRLQFKYDDRGSLVEVVDCAGRRIQIESDEAGRIVALTAPHPNDSTRRIIAARYRYDTFGNLTTVWDALDQPMDFAYANHLLVRETDRRGHSFYFEYDGAAPSARCIRTWGDAGIYARKLTYAPDAGLTVVENSLGQKSTYEHQDGLVIKEVDPLGGVTEAEFNEFGEIILERNALGHETAFDYDERGNVTGMVLPDGARISAEYGPSDQQTLVTDELGGKWTFLRDQSGRILEERDPLGAVTKYRHDSRHLIGMTDALGQQSRLVYDTAGNLVEISTPSGPTRNEYDGWGRIVAEIDANGNVERRHYDFLNRVTQIEEMDGNRRTYNYDAEGNVTSIRDAYKETTYAHQGTGRLSECIEAGRTVRFLYDTEEQLTAIVNEHSSVFKFELDPLGRVVTESGFDGVMRKYEYDPCDRVTRVVRPGNRSSEYVHDPLGRVLSVRHSDGMAEGCEYRKDGELVRIAMDDIVVTFEHDALGRVLKESRGQHWVASEYDALGQRVRVTSSFGLRQEIVRDVWGDAATLRERRSGYETCFVRDSLGLEMERSLPGGIRSRWQRDRLGRAIKHTIDGRSAVFSEGEFTWQSDGRLTRIVRRLGGSIDYQHDARGNLMQAQHSDGTLEMRMPDAVGNLFKSATRDDRGYGPAGQLLWARGPNGITHYKYDPEGNLVEKCEPSGSIWRYEWNCAGRLVRIIRPDGGEVTFAYDGLGRRIRKTYRGRATEWIWDGNLPIHEWTAMRAGSAEAALALSANMETNIRRREEVLQPQLIRGPPERADQPEVTTWMFEPESFAPLAKFKDGKAYSIVTDDLGTPVLMLDDAGIIGWRAEFNTYGELKNLEGPRHACPFRFPGQYEDEETGLYYNRYRYYDPDAGEYISQDPFALLAGLRLYAYVNDPLAWCDPLGLNLSSKAMGDAAEASAKRRLRSQKQSVIGAIENTSGHGVDIVSRNKAGDVEVHEVKANSSQLNKHQKKGADSYARRQSRRANKVGFKHNKRNSKKAALALNKAIQKGGRIKGTILRYKVDSTTGKVSFASQKKWGTNCK